MTLRTHHPRGRRSRPRPERTSHVVVVRQVSRRCKPIAIDDVQRRTHSVTIREPSRHREPVRPPLSLRGCIDSANRAQVFCRSRLGRRQPSDSRHRSVDGIDYEPIVLRNGRRRLQGRRSTRHQTQRLRHRSPRERRKTSWQSRRRRFRCRHRTRGSSDDMRRRRSGQTGIAQTGPQRRDHGRTATAR
jgi:hypothetical protein